MKIKTRLAIYFTLIVMIVLISFSLGIFLISEKYRMDKFRERMENRALTYSRLLIDVQEVDSLLLDIIDKNTFNEFPGEKIIIFNNKEEVIYENNKQSHENVSRDEFLDLQNVGKSYEEIEQVERVGLRYISKGQLYYVFVSSSDINGHEDIQNLRNIMIFGLSIGLIIVFVTGLFYSSRVLNPIKKMALRMEGITAKHLSERLPEGNRKDEISRLALTFNSMLNRLETAFELQNNFLSNASHELRTPLTAITGQVEVALLKERTAEYYQKLLDSIHSDLLELNQLLNSLLDLAHSGMEIAVLNFQYFRIDELLLNVRSMLKQRMAKDLVLVRFPDFPDDEDQLMVYGNENLLKIALFNLIDNALKFSDNQMVEISLTFQNHRIRLEIIDQGMGISEEDLPHIFTPFYRSSDAKIKRGSGLGLSLVRKIVHLHNGKIEAKRNTPIGTIFFLEFSANSSSKL